MQSLVDVRLGNDVRQSDEYATYMERLGWDTERVGGAHIFIRRAGPITLAKLRRPGPVTDWEKVRSFRQRQKIAVLQADPEVAEEAEMNRYGMKLARSQLLGTKTLLVDLRPDSSKILSGFKTETRYKLRKNEQNEVPLVWNDVEYFYTVLKQGYKDIGVWCPPPEHYHAFTSAFNKKSFCVVAGGESGCLVTLHEGVAEYYYAASTPAGKQRNLPYMVVWEAMKEAKKRGALVWDFNGLYDPRWPDARWKGFSFFKQRFGGVELEFAGTYIKYGWW